tara:strand:+ start:190 stop:369 length:180 start_codon:yes stop_codon:yes gene_type:complete
VKLVVRAAVVDILELVVLVIHHQQVRHRVIMVVVLPVLAIGAAAEAGEPEQSVQMAPHQ